MEDVAEETLRCKFRRVLYPAGYRSSTSPLGTWCVILYTSIDNSEEFKCIGTDLPDIPECEITLVGEWKNDPKYGRTFAATCGSVVAPTDKTAIIAYLSSLKIGIGPKRAGAIAIKYGAELWNVLENNPYELCSVGGIKKDVVNRLMEKLGDTRMEREFVREFGTVVKLSAAMLRQMRKEYGENAISVFRDNPYELCNLKGVSFPHVDELRRRNGIKAGDPRRIAAGAVHILKKARGDGKMCYPISAFLQEAGNYLGVSQDDLKEGLRDAWRSKKIVSAGGHFYLPENYKKEKSCAADAIRLLNNPVADIKGIDTLISRFEKDIGETLADKQKEAVVNALSKRMSIITGGPGTGKTTTIKAILSVYNAIYGDDDGKIMLLSPTGRAARRMEEATGHMAFTIHSALGLKVKEDSDDEEENATVEHLDADLIIVDEVSMLDGSLAALLLSAIRDESCLVLVGDPDQLPSVGAGNVLRELIDCQCIPTVALTVIYRQAENSPIVQNSGMINSGDTNLKAHNHFKIIQSNAATAFMQAVNTYESVIKRYGIENVMLLTPLRDKGQISAAAFNTEIQARINPPGRNKPEVIVKDTVFRLGDRVMQLKNTEQARNGDIGTVTEITPYVNDDGYDDISVIVTYDGWSQEYGKEDLKELTLAYACTVHKSQGAEYQTVLFVLSDAASVLLKRNLAYTAVTRAKENVAIWNIGNALEKAIKTKDTNKRYSLLGAMVRYYLNN